MGCRARVAFLPTLVQEMPGGSQAGGASGHFPVNGPSAVTGRSDSRQAKRDLDGARLSRRTAIGLAVAGAAAVLVGCGDDQDEEPTPTPTLFPGTPVGRVPGFDDPGRWAGRTLRVAAWGAEVQQALREYVWQPFARATGCTIREMTTDYAQLVESVRAGEPYADVLLVDSIWAETALERRVVEPIAPEEVQADRFQPFAPTEAAVPAYAYAIVSAFRRDAVLRIGEPQTWREWWNRERWQGRRALPRQAFASFEFALLADGVSPDRLYPLDGPRAIESLKRISGRIVDLWWDSGQQPVQWLSRRRAAFAAAWHYRVVAGQRDGRPIAFIWNQGLILPDSWVIARGSPARDIAVDMVNFATAPSVQAALARAVALGPVVPTAFDFIDRSLRPVLPTAPEHLDQLIRVNTAWWARHQTEANEQFNCWLLGGPCLYPTPTPHGVTP